MKAKHLIAALLVVSAFIDQAFALNTQMFHPLIGQQNQGLTVYGSEGLRKGNAQLGVFVNLTDDPLEFSLPPDNRVDQIVDEFVTADLLFSYGLTDWFTFHAGVPLNVYSNVEPIAAFQSTEDGSFGDLRFSGTLSLYRKWDEVDPSVKRGGFALIPFFTVPMDNTDDFFGDSSWTGGGLIAFDRHLGKRSYIGINLGARFRERERLLNLVLAHQMLASGSYVYRLSCKHKLDFLAEIQSSTTFRNFYSEEVTSPVEVFFGLRKQSQSRHWEWNLGTGRGINNGYGAPDFHVYGGLSYLFFRKNAPGKHCCEIVPSQPAAIEEKQVVQDLGSIHLEIVDSDGKPVILPIRIIKNEIPIVSNTTNRIKQPIEVGTYTIEVDHTQKIVETIVVVSNEEAYKKIVIPVVSPKEPEAIVRYIEPIYFDSNKDTIKPESFAALDEVYSIILEFPKIQSIQIEAHTDSQGSDAYNLDLSNRRAESAKQYLVRKGISATQIKAQGFGEVRPIETNATAEGRSKNRRVEFLIESPDQNVKIIQKK